MSKKSSESKSSPEERSASKNAESKTAQSQATPVAPVDLKTLAHAALASVLAWFLPGAGHLYLGRRGRAVYFAVLVLFTLGIGWSLEGRLPWVFSGSPLPMLATFGCLGSGLPLLILKFGLGYQGNFDAAGFEYGATFILTAGLMNLMLALDAFDIAMGRKE